MNQIRRSESGGGSRETRETLPAGIAVERGRRKNETRNQITRIRSSRVIDYLPRVNCQPEISQNFHRSQKQSPRRGKNDGNFFPARPFVEMRAVRLHDRPEKSSNRRQKNRWLAQSKRS